MSNPTHEELRESGGGCCVSGRREAGVSGISGTPAPFGTARTVASSVTSNAPGNDASTEPSGLLVPERDEVGRFVVGNRLAVGHGGGAARIARYRSAVFAAVTEEDVRAIVRALIDEAKAGNVLAAHEILDRLLGKARPVEEDRGDSVSELLAAQHDSWMKATPEEQAARRAFAEERLRELKATGACP